MVSEVAERTTDGQCPVVIELIGERATTLVKGVRDERESIDLQDTLLDCEVDL